MIIEQAILGNETAFEQLCQSHKVKMLYAFGSSVKETFDFTKSDIDLLVEIEEPDPLLRGDLLLSLWDAFEAFFHRKVDLLTPASISNPYLQNSIDQTKILIYDRYGAKIFV